MGGCEGPHWRRITYSVPAAGDPSDSNPGTVTVQDAQGTIEQLHTLWWPYLEGLLGSMRCAAQSSAMQALPFDFWGGLVGYLGYELKAECGGAAAHHSCLPDAAVFLADRQVPGCAWALCCMDLSFPCCRQYAPDELKRKWATCRLIALDHKLGDIFLVALVDMNSTEQISAASAWRQQRAADVELALQRPCCDVGTAAPQTNGHANGHSNGSCNRHDSTDEIGPAPLQTAATDDVRHILERCSNGQAEVSRLIYCTLLQDTDPCKLEPPNFVDSMYRPASLP